MATGRVAGIGVLAGAALLLAVIAGQVPRTTDGTAVAAPVPGPPSVGECLVARAGSDALLVGDRGLRSAGRDLRTCPEGAGSLDPSTVVLGEVAAVLDEGSGRPQDACGPPVSEFIGGPVPVADGVWTSGGGPEVLIVNPDRRQWADGQRWQACVLLPPTWTADGLMDPTRGIGAAPLESARGRWADPIYRDRLGDCLDEYRGTIATLYAPAFCGRGHELERLGLMSVAADPWSAALLRQSCTELAAARTAASDPSYGGRLRIGVVVTAADGTSREVADDGEELPDDASAECLLRPTDPARLLTGTVTGLGAGPVPLAPR